MKPTSRTIIQVVADPGPGGAPRHVRDLILGLKEQAPNWRIILIAPTGWLTEAVGDHADIQPLTFPNAWGRSVHNEFLEIIRQITGQASQPTIIHFQGVRAGIAGRLALARAGLGHLPIIYTEHLWTNDYHLTSRLREFAQLRLLRSCDRMTTKTIAVSQAVADFLLAKHLTSQEKLVVIPNGVAVPDKKQLAVGSWQLGEDSKTHSTNSELPTPNYHKISFRLGSVGTLVSLKGYETLLSALPLIIQNLPQTRLDIVGDGPEHARLVRQIKDLKLTDQVRLLGSLSDGELTRQRASWDLFVSASYSESFGLAIAEAMAAGLPVITPAVGGIPELVTPETGVLIQPRQPHELAKAIIDLLPQHERRQRLGQAGRSRIESHFSLEAMVVKTINLYQELF